MFGKRIFYKLLSCVLIVTMLFPCSVNVLAEDIYVEPQGSIEISDFSEPEENSGVIIIDNLVGGFNSNSDIDNLTKENTNPDAKVDTLTTEGIDPNTETDGLITDETSSGAEGDILEEESLGITEINPLIEDVVLKIEAFSDAPVGAIEVTDHDTLVSAIASGSNVDILLMNDITLAGAITLTGTKTLNFYTEASKTVTIYSTASARHFTATTGTVNTTFNFFDDVILDGNTTAGGINFTSTSGTLTVDGIGTIQSCKTASNGGAIYSTKETVIKGNTEISNNIAATSGGGIYGAATTISGNVKINNNTSSGTATSAGGGGVYSSGALIITDSVEISNNIASYGGGIRAASTASLSGNINITNNTALTNGGCILIATLTNLTVGSGVTLSGNKAGSYKYWAIDTTATSGDSKTHVDNIQTTSFSSFNFDGKTVPFPNSYNNYDVAYTATVPTTAPVQIQYVEKGNETNVLKTEIKTGAILQNFNMSNAQIFTANATSWKPILAEASPSTSILVWADVNQNKITVPCSETTESPTEYNIPEGAVAVTDHDTLVSAIASGSSVDIFLINDFTLVSDIMISGTKALNFYTEFGETRTIYPALTANTRHFTITAASSNITFNFFNDIILNGNETGGGINLNAASGNLSINGGTIQSCKTTSNGGAISSAGTGSILNISNSTKILNNTAAGSGGGIYGSASQITINDSVLIDNNISNSSGGGIYGGGTNNSINISGNAKITNNSAKSAGGIYSTGTNNSVNISENAHISNNAAIANGGGMTCVGSAISISGDSVIDNNTSDDYGGGIYLNYSTLNISDRVQITNNAAYFDGGGICDNIIGNSTKSTINITGNVQISNNSTTKNGGAINCFLPNLTIGSDVTFSGNTAPFYTDWEINTLATSGNSKIYMNNIQATLFSSYTPKGETTPKQFSNAYNNYDISFSHPTASITVEYVEKDKTTNILKAKKATVPVGETYNADDADFKALEQNWHPILTDAVPSASIIVIADPISTQNVITVPCSLSEGDGDSSEPIPPTAIEVIDRNTLVNAINSGAKVDILLKNDITLTGAITLSGTKTINLYNEPGQRKSIYSTASARHFTTTTANSDITLKMTSGVILDGNGKAGGISSTATNGKYTISGGTFQNCQSSQGGAISVTGTDCILNIENDTLILKNSATGSSGGGGIYSNGTVTIKDEVVIDNNKSTSTNSASGGGGIYITGEFGKLILNGRVQITNNSGYTGGGIYGKTYGHTITINDDVLIDGNESITDFGGGVCSSTGILTINDNVQITNNTSRTNGGGICCDSSTLNISENVKISNNTASTATGGGVYGNANSTINISGNVVIDNNSCDATGGGIDGFSSSCILNITGNVQITNNTSRLSGGGIAGITVYISDNVQITGNTAIRNYGGGIYSTGVITLSGDVKIADNTVTVLQAGYGGGAIYGTGTISISDRVQIINNDTLVDGGGILGGANCSVNIIGNVQILNNSATNNGGGIFASLPKLTIGPDVTFSGNTANTYTDWEINTLATSGNSKLHMDNIQTISFSAYTPKGEEAPKQFSNAYNNYDISFSHPTAPITVDYVEKDTPTNILKTVTPTVLVGEAYNAGDAVFNANSENWQPILAEAVPSSSIIAIADPISTQNIITVPCTISAASGEEPDGGGSDSPIPCTCTGDCCQPCTCKPIPVGVTEVTDYTSLLIAINSGSEVDILLKNDITLDYAITLFGSKTINLYNEPGKPKKIYSAASSRHFTTSNDLTLNTTCGVTLDGNGTAGGIEYSKSLTISNGTLQNCTESQGGAIFRTGLSSGNLTLNKTKLLNNIATSSGGAIYSAADTTKIILNDTLLSGNEATNDGGGIYAYCALELNGNSRITGGKAKNGAGAYVQRTSGSDQISINGNSSVDNNEASNTGGGNSQQ